MARNKSEKLPRCPELHVYAKLCAQRLKDEMYHGPFNPVEWRCIPPSVKQELNGAFRGHDYRGQVHWAGWYAFIIAYAKANYGP